MPALIEYATVLALQGEQKNDMKEVKKAEKYFKHCLKIEPENIQANLRLGKVY